MATKDLNILRATSEMNQLLLSDFDTTNRMKILVKAIEDFVEVNPTINYVIDGREANMEDNYLDPVTYVPGHADGNAGHLDCEQGVLVNMTERAIFVLFSKGRSVQAVNAEHLVWG